VTGDRDAEAGPVRLTPDDTIQIITRASTITGLWSSVEIAREQDPYVLDLLRWSATVTERQHPRRAAELDHDAVVAAVRAMVAGRDELTLSTRSLDLLAAVVDAPSVEVARDELAQLDCFDCDKIIQYAVLGSTTYN
jgi:hypothetical protein